MSFDIFVALKISIFVFVVQSVILWAILKTSKWHINFSGDLLDGVQKVHEGLVPRVGGIAIALTFILTQFFFINDLGWFSIAILLSCILTFLAGAIEDFTKDASANLRLLAAISSAAIFIVLTDYVIDDLGFSLLNLVLSVGFVSFLFTIFSISGVINAFNIIDGFNGLATGLAFINFVFMILLSYMLDDYQLAYIAIFFASCALTFLLFNYPNAKIFLGDGGAYLLGAFVATMSIVIFSRHNQGELSPWFFLVLTMHPVIEVVYSIFRRILSKLRVNQPDANHLHTLIKNNFIDLHFAHLAGWKRNALVAPTIWLPNIFFSTLAIFFKSDTYQLFYIFILYTVTYIFVYKRLSNNFGENFTGSKAQG